jgi:hypothetical protein
MIYNVEYFRVDFFKKKNDKTILWWTNAITTLDYGQWKSQKIDGPLKTKKKKKKKKSQISFSHHPCLILGMSLRTPCKWCGQ